jgi:hypothetical protein
MVAFEKKRSMKVKQGKPDRQRNGGAVPAKMTKAGKPASQGNISLILIVHHGSGF